MKTVGLMTFTGCIAAVSGSGRHPADALSFIRRRADGIDYWAVEDSTDRRADYAMGERLGAEYLEFIGENPTNGNAELLGQIVAGMARTGDDRGKIDASALGFLRAVNDYAVAAAAIMAMPSDGERNAGR